MFGGLRWVLTQVLLKSSSFGLNGTIDTLYHVAPTMAFTLLPFALAAEGERISHSPMLFGDFDTAVVTLLAVLMGTVLAFFLTISEFLLVEYAGR
jgi:solute carrier family 35 protein C2